MEHAIYKFDTVLGYDHAFVMLHRMSKDAIFYRHADVTYYDKYNAIVLSYKDCTYGEAVEHVVFDKLNESVPVEVSGHSIDITFGFTADYPHLADNFTEKDFVYAKLCEYRAQEFKKTLDDYDIEYSITSKYDGYIYFTIYCDELERYLLNEWL